MKSVIFVTLTIVAIVRCGIIERGFYAMGDAAHIAQEGFADMVLTGKDLMFGRGIRTGPGLMDQGLIPGMIHRAGNGLHLFGEGISKVFSGDYGIRDPLNMMKNKLAAEAAAVGPGAAAVGPGAAVVDPGAAAGPVAETAAPVAEAAVPMPQFSL